MQRNQVGIIRHGESKTMAKLNLPQSTFRPASCCRDVTHNLHRSPLDQISCYLIRQVNHFSKQVTGAKAQWLVCMHTCKQTHFFQFAVVHSVNTTGISTRPPPHAKASHLCLFFSALAACMKLASLPMCSAPFMPLCSLLSKSSCCKT